MSITLYELSEEAQIAEEQIMLWAEEHDGDITDCPFNDILDNLKGDINQKCLNIASLYKNLNAEAKAIKDEEKVLSTRRKALENKCICLGTYVSSHIPKEKAFEIKDARHKIKWSASKSTWIESDLEFGKLEHIKDAVKVTKSFNLTEIKKHIQKNGPIEIDGEVVAKISNNLNLQIK